MNKSKLLALVLSFNFGIFGGNVYAGNGHPLSEHTDLVGKYIVEEKKLAKSLNLFENACGIKYRQKGLSNSAVINLLIRNLIIHKYIKRGGKIFGK